MMEAPDAVIQMFAIQTEYTNCGAILHEYENRNQPYNLSGTFI